MTEQLTSKVILNRTTPPTLQEAKAALHSQSSRPRIASKYGIPIEVIESARAAAWQYGAGSAAKIMLRNLLEYLYPAGTRVRLDAELEGEGERPKARKGDQGSILSIDAGPNIQVEWDNGAVLNLLTGVDQFTLLVDIDVQGAEAGMREGVNGDGEFTCQECGAALTDGLRCPECDHHQEPA